MSPHDAGVANEWEQKLPEKDEQRWQELDKKRRELQKEGQVLPAHEYEEWLALDQRKFPYGRDARGNRPRKKEHSASTRFPKLDKHYEKHIVQKKEWDPPISKEAYAERATELADKPVGGSIEGFTSKEGYVFRYDQETNELVTIKPDGTIETMFKPERGYDYYLEQLKKYGK